VFTNNRKYGSPLTEDVKDRETKEWHRPGVSLHRFVQALVEKRRLDLQSAICVSTERKRSDLSTIFKCRLHDDYDRSKPSKRAIRSLYAQTRLCDISDAVTPSQLHAPSELVMQGLQHQFDTLLTVVLSPC
jgi:hypothetical protein